MRAWKPFPPPKKKKKNQKRRRCFSGYHPVTCCWKTEINGSDWMIQDRRSCIKLNTQMLQIKWWNTAMVTSCCFDLNWSWSHLLFWSELKLITFYNCFLYTLVCLSYATFKLKNSRPHLYCSVLFLVECIIGFVARMPKMISRVNQNTVQYIVQFWSLLMYYKFLPRPEKR